MTFEHVHKLFIQDMAFTRALLVYWHMLHHRRETKCHLTTHAWWPIAFLVEGIDVVGLETLRFQAETGLYECNEGYVDDIREVHDINIDKKICTSGQAAIMECQPSAKRPCGWRHQRYRCSSLMRCLFSFTKRCVFAAAKRNILTKKTMFCIYCILQYNISIYVSILYCD